jgi:hypothetical protein
VIAGFEQLEDKTINRELLLNRKFCNFVYSNWKWADPIRKRFFLALSEYKKIDSGGRYMNNIGNLVQNKIDFIKDYKFTIAFENSALSGYTTEKIVEPMTVNSLPIYWGNPDIHLDFNADSFVHVKKSDDIDVAIEEIIRLDKDDEAYIQKLSQPWYTGENYSKWELKLLSFFQHIFDQPIEDAKRRTDYGFVRTYRRKQETMDWLFTQKIMRLTFFNKEINVLIGNKK